MESVLLQKVVAETEEGMTGKKNIGRVTMSSVFNG